MSEFEGLPSGSSTGAAAWEFLVVRAVMLEGVVGGRRGCRVSIKEPLKCEKGDVDRRIGLVGRGRSRGTAEGLVNEDYRLV